VGVQLGDGVRAERFLHARCVHREKAADQRREVRGPVAKGRYAERDHVQAMVEVLAKLTPAETMQRSAVSMTAAAMRAGALNGIDVSVPPSDDRPDDRPRSRPSDMNKDKREAEWAEAKRRCRLTPEMLAMAQELRLNPRGLIKNIPNRSEPWKAPAGVWIRELHRTRQQNAARRRAGAPSRAAEGASPLTARVTTLPQRARRAVEEAPSNDEAQAEPAGAISLGAGRGQAGGEPAVSANTREPRRAASVAGLWRFGRPRMPASTIR
jgi:hypothetical protein